MKLHLAGYNIDKSLIDNLKSDRATPETLSAAYARISRSNKDVDALRAEAMTEIEKARKSNTNIIFEMGHSSVAEHAVFNLDLIGVSRALTELVQRSRIASFTEKSQRYVTFGKDYVVPKELNNRPKLKQPYKELMNALFEEYEASYLALCSFYEKTMPKLKARDREALAKEDARYILPLSTKTQMGMTINARSLENLLRRLSKSPLEEAAELKERLYIEVSQIAPSLLRYTENDGYTGMIDLEKVGFTGFLQQELPWVEELDLENKLKLLNAPVNPDDTILAAIIYQQGELSWNETRETVSGLPRMIRQQLWNQVFNNLKAWHKLPRAFETVDFSFELSMSESCWAQFKRHRYCTILRKGGNSQIVKIPESIRRINRSEEWLHLARQASRLGNSLPNKLNQLSAYYRINASILTVYAKMNLREIYHFTRLRSDEHAQWEIRELSHLMADQIKKSAPHAASLLCGKSEFPSKAY
jgi:flavin-dependent thymidylate synthase